MSRLRTMLIRIGLIVVIFLVVPMPVSAHEKWFIQKRP